ILLYGYPDNVSSSVLKSGQYRLGHFSTKIAYAHLYPGVGGQTACKRIKKGQVNGKLGFI
ncbi:hypothetical protein, partial [uncultured Cloacibacillus sp.]|uniref:hypothetical protein n=1 Tax=uncultured Cloacibacillus sp. TaxID=889794 RepID=UPI00258913F7